MADISSALPQAANYTGMQIQADPATSFLKAANLGAQTNLLNAQSQQAQAQSTLTGIQVAKQQAYPQMLQQVLHDPTPSNFAALTAMFPEQHQAITSSFDMSQLAQRQAVIQPMAQAYSAMLNGRPDLAKNIVQQQKDALLNSNQNSNDPQVQSKLQHADTLLQQIETDPKAATGLIWGRLHTTLLSVARRWRKAPPTPTSARRDLPRWLPRRRLLRRLLPDLACRLATLEAASKSVRRPDSLAKRPVRRTPRP